ncbi:MAG: hypothetical protein HY650_14995 [Acidobacteria bacterium]|nr:hypothetical protein [Acidobacteriota bacterium]
MTKTVLLVLLLTGMGGQNPPVPIEVSLGEKFILKAGREAVVLGTQFRFKFNRVVQDSRCPEGVVCVWQGNGQVHIDWERSHGRLISVLLNTGIAPADAECGGYQVSLVALRPAAKPDVVIDPEEYEAVLMVKSVATESR